MTTIIKKDADSKLIKTNFSKVRKGGKSLDTTKYCGFIKIDKSAVQYQKDLRNEWQ